MFDVWLYELDFPKNMEINWDNVWTNIKIKHVKLEKVDDSDIQKVISKYSHDINEDDFDGTLPTIYNYARNDLGAIKGFLDGITYSANNCDYYNFTNAPKYHAYKTIFQNMYDAIVWNNGYIPNKEVIEIEEDL